jgi:hypothetical protein
MKQNQERKKEKVIVSYIFNINTEKKKSTARFVVLSPSSKLV